jgi:3-hydroxyisobutyrate dehydrogenase-like beta-hydroxyacid dehydrogenase
MRMRIGLIGFGEVGSIMGAGLRGQASAVSAWDRLLPDALASVRMREAARSGGIELVDGPASLCAASDLIISAVTASSTLSVAKTIAASIRRGCWFLDLNSASPGTKQRAAALIDEAAGRYVEAGVMTSVPPHGIAVPMLLGGPHATALAPILSAWGMKVEVASERIGIASATKMCRSVMIKGLEALVIESYTTARHHGVEQAMIATLRETFPGIDWSRQGEYFFSRVAQHGRRRAEEMREAANTVREAGFEPFMASAIAGKHDWMAAAAVAGGFSKWGTGRGWQAYADQLLQQGQEAANDE